MTDESIIDLYFARDSMAIHYSQEQHGNLCHAVASNILPTLEDAQECVNDTWLKAWNSIPPTRPKHLGAYLSRITRNLSLERWRTIHAQKRGGNSGTVPLDELAECLSGGEDPADTAAMHALEQGMGRFLKSLRQTERAVFLSRYWYCASVREIALHFGFSESRVKTMLFRTRKKLRTYLEKEGLL